MLDNRRMAMIEDATSATSGRPLSSINTGVMQYVDAPLLAVAPGRDLSPSAALDLAALPGLISPSN